MLVWTDSKFDSARLRFSLLWHISVMKQDSYASLFQLGGKDFTAQLQVWKCALIQPLINPGLFWARGSWPWENHTSMKSPVKASTLSQERNSHKPSLTFPLLHWDSRMWPVAWGHDRLYDFKTIDRGGVCQSHHQELIGPRVPFLITTVTCTPGGDLKSKKFCQCVRQGVMTAKKQTAQVWLIGKNQRKDAFLILGVPVLPAFKMWNKNRSEKGTEFHYLLFWVTWSQPEVSGKTQMADYTRLIPCAPHSHDPRETTSTQNQSYAHSVGGLEPV